MEEQQNFVPLALGAIASRKKLRFSTRMGIMLHVAGTGRTAPDPGEFAMLRIPGTDCFLCRPAAAASIFGIRQNSFAQSLKERGCAEIFLEKAKVLAAANGLPEPEKWNVYTCDVPGGLVLDDPEYETMFRGLLELRDAEMRERHAGDQGTDADDDDDDDDQKTPEQRGNHGSGCSPKRRVSSSASIARRLGKEVVQRGDDVKSTVTSFMESLIAASGSGPSAVDPRDLISAVRESADEFAASFDARQREEEEAKRKTKRTTRARVRIVTGGKSCGKKKYEGLKGRQAIPGEDEGARAARIARMVERSKRYMPGGDSSQMNDMAEELGKEEFEKEEEEEEDSIVDE